MNTRDCCRRPRPLAALGLPGPLWSAARWPVFCLAAFVVIVAGCKPTRTKEAQVPPTNAPAPAAVLSGRIAAALDAIRQTGCPATLAELDQSVRTPPPAENAAVKFTEAFALLVPPPPAAQRLPGRAERLSPDLKAVIQASMAANKVARERLHAAAALKQSRYQVDWKDGFNTKLPHLAKIKTAAQVLRLEAFILTENSRPDLAAGSVLTGVGLARSLEAEPILISQLTRVAALTMAHSGAERILNQQKMPDPQLAALQNAFREAESPESVARALAGERCSGLQLFQASAEQVAQMMAATGDTSLPPEFAASLGEYLKKNKDADFLFYLEVMEGYVAAARQPFPQSVEAARLVAARVDAQQQQPPDQKLLLSAAFLPAYGKTALRFAENVARLRAAQAACAVERYRAANGDKLPENLSALVPAQLSAVPTDPFDGQPLRFKPLGKGYVVYSVGADARDDGGREKPAGATGETGYDVTFTVER